MTGDHGGSQLQKIDDSQNSYLNSTFWDVYPLFTLVQNGNVDELATAFDLRLDAFPTKGRITSSVRKQYEYLTVSLVNTFMIAAILGGAYPPEANWIADRALKRLSVFRRLDEIPSIVRDAAFELCELSRDARLDDTGNPYVEQAKRYLSTHLTQEIRNEDVAQAVGLSPFYLSRIFKAHTGQTIREYLTDQRVQTAKHLLAFDERSISQIASLLRFCDQSYFTQVFRRRVGLTPRQYRDANRR